MTSIDIDGAVLRVTLFARAIRVAAEPEGSRLLHGREVDAMVRRLRQRTVPSLEAFFDLGTLAALPGSHDGHYYYYQLVVWVFRKRHPFTFSSQLNSPALLRAFWRAVAELVFCNVTMRAAVSQERVEGYYYNGDDGGAGHPLVFHTADGLYEVELTDDRGSDWCFIVSLSPELFGCRYSDELRSRAGTPEIGR